jgi:hypothetical protein
MPERGTNRRWARRGRTYPRVGVIQHKRRRRILQVKCWAEVWASRIYCLPTVCRMQSVVCIVLYCVVLCLCWAFQGDKCPARSAYRPYSTSECNTCMEPTKCESKPRHATQFLNLAALGPFDQHPHIFNHTYASMHTSPVTHTWALLLTCACAPAVSNCAHLTTPAVALLAKPAVPAAERVSCRLGLCD